LTKDKILLELKKHNTKDETLLNILGTVWEIIKSLTIVKKLDGLELIIYKQEQASPNLKESPYNTLNCKTILNESLVIINERFFN